jgi:hypothetical protein
VPGDRYTRPTENNVGQLGPEVVTEGGAGGFSNSGLAQLCRTSSTRGQEAGDSLIRKQAEAANSCESS